VRTCGSPALGPNHRTAARRPAADGRIKDERAGLLGRNEPSALNAHIHVTRVSVVIALRAQSFNGSAGHVQLVRLVAAIIALVARSRVRRAATLLTDLERSRTREPTGLTADHAAEAS
jgi:hypothetical protein